MSDQREPKEFALADDERIVRSYACTRFHRLLGPAGTGYLTVTNRRIAYHCETKSVVGRANVVVAEMPLDDVGGIRSSVAISINYILVFLFAAFLYFVIRLAFIILPNWVTSWVFLVLLAVPYAVVLAFVKGFISQEVRDKLADSVDTSKVGEFIRRRDSDFYVGILRIVFLVVLLFLAGKLAFETPFGASHPVLARVPLVAACLWVYRNAVRRFLSFSLAISARSSRDAGILIPGQGLSQLIGLDFAQLRSLWASPAEDAEQVVKELGALLTDIRLMGDLGIEKWSTPPADPDAVLNS